MKYGVEVTIVQHGYVEVEAECESEAKANAEAMATSGDILFHEIEVTETKITGYF